MVGRAFAVSGPAAPRLPGVGWILAESLAQFRAQCNALAPNRSKASDGTIGDAAHQKAGTSDHLPRRIAGADLVTAFDATHDPVRGLNCHQLASALQRAKDPRVKYVIWNKLIMSGAAGPSPWTWRAYKGSNPHTRHLHLSVVGDKRCRDASPWTLPGLTGGPDGSGGADWRSLPILEHGMRNDPRVKRLQGWLTRMYGYCDFPATGNYLDQTAKCLAEFQRRTGVRNPDGSVADGRRVGDRTRQALWTAGFRG